MCLALYSTVAWAQSSPPEHNGQQVESRIEGILREILKEQDELIRLMGIIGRQSVSEVGEPLARPEGLAVSPKPSRVPVTPANRIAPQSPDISPPSPQSVILSKPVTISALPTSPVPQPQIQAAPPSNSSISIPNPTETVQLRPSRQTSANALQSGPSGPSISEPVQLKRPELTSLKGAQPQSSGLSSAEIREMLAHGQNLFESGDIAGARLLFTRAASGNNPEALTALARTYDPDMLRKVQVRGIRPDKAKAEALYREAQKAYAGR